MSLKQLTSATADLGAMLDKESDLRALLVKWLEKHLKAKSTTLDILSLMARAHGDGELLAVLGSVSEPTVRALAKRLDPKNKAFAAMSSFEIVAHVVALAKGARVPEVPAQRAAKPQGAAKKSTKDRGDVLERSKYPKSAA
jgi:hypothetical protein